MAIVVKFDVTGMSSTKYDHIIRRLAANGLGAPDGRLLQELGVVAKPEVVEAYNIIKG